MMYNIMAADPMLDSLYLFQPRGPGTAYLFRMPTPAALVGRLNPGPASPTGARSEKDLAARGG
jgi:hypothetical protein